MTRQQSLTEDTPVRMPLGRFWTILVCCVTVSSGATYYVGEKLNAILGEVRQLNLAVAGGWTVADQRRWASRLQWENRLMPLAVPDVDEARTPR